MPFIQVVEYQTDRPDEVRALSEQWSREQVDNAPSRVVLMEDRDDPGHFMMMAEFDSYEQAMAHSDRPRTGEYAERMRRLATAEPRYVNLDLSQEQR